MTFFNTFIEYLDIFLQLIFQNQFVISFSIMFDNRFNIDIRNGLTVNYFCISFKFDGQVNNIDISFASFHL
jgi:hypothetical protein